MQPSPETMVPMLVLFIAVGVVHAVFARQMLGYWDRFYAFFRFGFRSRLSRSLGGIRAFGIVYAIAAGAMLTGYLWQWFHQRGM